jgi:hypothetical protein
MHKNQHRLLTISGLLPIAALGLFRLLTPSQAEGGSAGANGCYYNGQFYSQGACVGITCWDPPDAGPNGMICEGGYFDNCGCGA